jgi:hypothetical protein
MSPPDFLFSLLQPEILHFVQDEVTKLVDKSAGFDLANQRHVGITLGIFLQDFRIFSAHLLDRQLKILPGRIGPGRKIIFPEVFFEHFAVLELHIFRQHL